METSIDVYFCHIPNECPEAGFRDHLARACLERWRQDPLASITLFQPAGTRPLMPSVAFEEGGDVAQFHQARYRIPQARRRSDWFVVADDDCLPLGRDFVARALAAAKAQPEFGVLAASDVVGTPIVPAGDSDIAESHAVGGICFVSPQCPTFDFDVAHPSHADGARYHQVQQRGLREGRLLGVRMNHLCYGFSTVVPGYWCLPPSPR